MLLKREPNNPYDPNAVAVLDMKHNQMVGHVPRAYALAVAKVADDKRMKILMVGQVEGGADQMYKFRLRISFFGRPTVPSSGGLSTRTAVNDLLRPVDVLTEPKPRAPPKSKAPKAPKDAQPRRAAPKSGGGAASSSNAVEAPPPAAADEEDDEVEFSHERTYVERNIELLKHAVVLE